MDKKTRIVYEKLKEVARKGELLGTISYSALGIIVELDMKNTEDRNEMSGILHSIVLHEHSHNRPLLTAIVLHKTDPSLGIGFYKAARECGIFPKGDKASDLAKIEFLAKEMNRVYECWAK
jgi:hypothetical protein